MTHRFSSIEPRASRLHPDRAARRHRDHRRPDRALASRRAVGPRGGPPCPVHQQPQAARPGPGQLRELQRLVPDGVLLAVVRRLGIAGLRRQHRQRLRPDGRPAALLRAGPAVQRLQHLGARPSATQNATVDGTGVGTLWCPSDGSIQGYRATSTRPARSTTTVPASDVLHQLPRQLGLLDGQSRRRDNRRCRRHAAPPRGAPAVQRRDRAQRVRRRRRERSYPTVQGVGRAPGEDLAASPTAPATRRPSARSPTGCSPRPTSAWQLRRLELVDLGQPGRLQLRPFLPDQSAEEGSELHGDRPGRYLRQRRLELPPRRRERRLRATARSASSRNRSTTWAFDPTTGYPLGVTRDVSVWHRRRPVPRSASGRPSARSTAAKSSAPIAY